MRYLFCLLALTIAVGANAQTDVQHTPKGAIYQVLTHGTGNKIAVSDVVTFQFVQKTDKDSVLYSTYANGGEPVKVQVTVPQNVGDLMEIFPQLTVGDSVMIKVPTDSIFATMEDRRPPFLKKGSNLVFLIKIEKSQTVDEVMTEMKAAEQTDAAKYIAEHKLVLKTTPSGLKYEITKPSLKPKPLSGDTLYVNYTGRTLDDKVFDSSVDSVAKKAGLDQPGRTYEPIVVVVGAGKVIAGWDEGLLLLNEGSKAKFVIPSSLAYGPQGSGAQIRPFSTLVFDIELVKVKRIKHAPVATAAKKKPLHKGVVKKTS